MWSSDYRLAKCLLDQRLSEIQNRIEKNRIAETAKAAHTPNRKNWPVSLSFQNVFDYFFGQKDQEVACKPVSYTLNYADVGICNPDSRC
jgi:hypothetical protein